MFTRDPRTGHWTPSMQREPGIPLIPRDRDPSPGLNRHGCWILFGYDWKDCRVQTGYVATMEGVREMLVKTSGEDPHELEDEFATMVDWAKNAKPGAVECFYNIHWLIALDPNEDGGCHLQDLGSDLDDPRAEAERYEALCKACGREPW